MPTGTRNILPPANTWNSNAVCRMVGCTPRQLIRWAAEGVLGEWHTNLGQGNRHAFTKEDIRVIKVVNRLTEVVRAMTTEDGRGGGLKFLTEAAAYVRRHPNMQDLYVSFGPRGMRSFDRVPNSKEYLRIVIG